METVTAFLQTALDYAQAGYQQVNAVLGLIIAFVAAFVMTQYGRILFITVGAVVVHEIVVTLMPVVNGTSGLKLPDILQRNFWDQVLFLLIGYFIIITIFYMLRRILLRR